MNQDKLLKFYNVIERDPNGRYKSWEHCHSYFVENRKTPNVDMLCLHLAFYLASWGMYRGSSFLLQKDYFVHKPVIEIIMDSKYDKLWNLSADDLLHKDSVIALIFDVKNKVVNAYKCQINCKVATDTLVTKILMGTFGCVPAYDRYFIEGIRSKKTAVQKFRTNSLKQIAKYYIDNKSEFESIREKINKNGVEYPPLKLLDMYFWQIGYDLDPKNK